MQKLTQTITSIALILLFTACSTAFDTGEHKGTGLKKTKAEPITKSYANTRANTGDVMFDSWPAESEQAITINRPVTATAAATKKLLKLISTVGKEYQVRIPSGTATIGYTDSKFIYYLADSPIMVGGRRSKGGIAVPKNERQAPKAFWFATDRKGRSMLAVEDATSEIDISPAYEKITDLAYTEGHGRTITYLGLKSGTDLQFVYKEYSGSMLRDAFTQEFTADYTPGKEYVFKGARWIVHSASPDQIEYTVTQNF